MVGEQPAIQAVHAFIRIAHRHGAERIAVIAAGESEKPRARPHPLVQPVLRSHFHRHFHRHRTAIGKKHMVQIAGQHRRQPRGEPFRRRVGKAAEHHMRHRGKLLRHRRADMRMVVAVTRRPPGGDAIDQRAAIIEENPAPLGAHGLQRGRSALHLRVGGARDGSAWTLKWRNQTGKARLGDQCLAPQTPLRVLAFPAG